MAAPRVGRTEGEATFTSSVPTERPDKQRPSLFAGLLAEASRDEKRRSQETLRIDGRKRTTQPPRPASQSGRDKGRRIGAYQVLGEIGSGGMAVVYKAVQPSLDRLVAIKELRPEFMHDHQVSARFEREATSLATIQHGNIVHIYDFIKEPDAAYIVMEYVDGIDLFDVLAEVEHVPVDVAAIVALQIAQGLECAHHRGIVHRDVKPSNVLISKGGEIKLMDFGIARDPGRADLTHVGMSLGTPAYMAPEQIAGDRIDFRADLFALGICLYEMISGHRPWGDDDGQSITRKVLHERYTPIRTHAPHVPEDLERAIEMCLEKDPARRPSSTYELRRILEAYVARELTHDPRQRLIVFLRNVKLLSESEASAGVPAELLKDAALVERDLGTAPAPRSNPLRPVVIASMLALLAIGSGVVLAKLGGLGRPLPAERPVLELKARAP